MTATYEAIATTTLGSNQATVTFSSISGNFTDLVLVVDYIASNTGIIPRITFNSDTGANYSRTVISGYGTPSSAVGSVRFSSVAFIGSGWQVGAGTTRPATNIYHIMNYSNTTTNKTVLARSNTIDATLTEVTAEVSLWRSTAAITSITLTASSNNFASGSTFTLYGIKAE